MAAAGLLWGATVSAQDAGKYDQRWYVSPSIGGVFADKENLDNGVAGSVSVGRALGRYTGFELEGGYSSLTVSDLPAENDYERLTLGANLLQYFANDKAGIRPFVIGSINAHQIDFLGEELSGAGVGLGLGSMFQMSPWWDLRLQ
ncbi:hypothetical protein C3942_14385, partial [Solimonas fluminis]